MVQIITDMRRYIPIPKRIIISIERAEVLFLYFGAAF